MHRPRRSAKNRHVGAWTRKWEARQAKHGGTATEGVHAQKAAKREPVLTPANLMSLSRIPMGLAVWLAPGSRALLLTLMGLAAASDVLDGWLARRAPGRRAEPGHIGHWLDPVCDKVFVIAVLAALAVALETPLWQLLLIGTRELLQLPLLAAHFLGGHRLGLPSRLDFRAGVPGKAATVAQFFAIGAIVVALRAVWLWCAIASTLGLISAAYYVRRAWTTGDRTLVAR